MRRKLLAFVCLLRHTRTLFRNEDRIPRVVPSSLLFVGLSDVHSMGSLRCLLSNGDLDEAI